MEITDLLSVTRCSRRATVRMHAPHRAHQGHRRCEDADGSRTGLGSNFGATADITQGHSLPYGKSWTTAVLFRRCERARGTVPRGGSAGGAAAPSSKREM